MLRLFSGIGYCFKSLMVLWSTYCSIISIVFNCAIAAFLAAFSSAALASAAALSALAALAALSSCSALSALALSSAVGCCCSGSGCGSVRFLVPGCSFPRSKYFPCLHSHFLFIVSGGSWVLLSDLFSFWVLLTRCSGFVLLLLPWCLVPGSWCLVLCQKRKAALPVLALLLSLVLM